MHLLGEDQKRGRKNRSPPERIFKWVNSLVMTVQLACFLITVAQVSIASSKTFSTDFFFPSEFGLKIALSTKTENCTVPITEDSFYSDIPVALSSYNRDYRLARLAYRVRRVIAFSGVMLAMSGFNRLLYDLNIYAFKYHYLVLRKGVVTLLEIMFIIITLVSCIAPQHDAKILRDYFKNCGVVNRNYLPHTIPFVALYISIGVTLTAHGVSFLILLINGTKKGPKPTSAAAPALSAERELSEANPPGEAPGALALPEQPGRSPPAVEGGEGASPDERGRRRLTPPANQPTQ